MRHLTFICSVICCLAVCLSILFGASRTQAGSSPKKAKIIYTNDTLGYLEPCGCGGRYLGGFSRRSTFISRVLGETQNVIILDSGNISNMQNKLPFITSLMAQMKYDAIGLGGSDTYFGDEFYKQAAANALKIIDSTSPETKWSVPSIIKSIGRVKIGVVSYGKFYSLPEPISADRLQTFYSTYKATRKASDILVLLDQGGIATPAWLNDTGAKLGAPDIVIGSSAKDINPTDKIIDKTHIVPTSYLGRQVGVIDIDLTQKDNPIISVKKELIDKDTAEDTDVKRRIDEFIRGASMQQVASSKMTSMPGMPTLGKGIYRSPETCKECHPDEYKDWQKTRHASAVNTLVSKDRMIADCLPCHSEEYRQTLKTTRRQSLPTGIECATCHASVLPHGDDGPAKTAIRKVDPKLCLSCHTPERSPDYNQSKYLPKVSHSMLNSIKTNKTSGSNDEYESNF